MAIDKQLIKDYVIALKHEYDTLLSEHIEDATLRAKVDKIMEGMVKVYVDENNSGVETTSIAK